MDAFTDILPKVHTVSKQPFVAQFRFITLDIIGLYKTKINPIMLKLSGLIMGVMGVHRCHGNRSN